MDSILPNWSCPYCSHTMSWHSLQKIRDKDGYERTMLITRCEGCHRLVAAPNFDALSDRLRTIRRLQLRQWQFGRGDAA
jgi:hypothetical protein